MFAPLIQCGAVQVSATMTHRDQFRSIYSCRKALPFPPTVISRITNCGSAKLFGRRIRGITLSVSMLLSSLCPTKESSSIWLKIRDGWKALGMAILLRCDIDEMLRVQKSVGMPNNRLAQASLGKCTRSIQFKRLANTINPAAVCSCLCHGSAQRRVYPRVVSHALTSISLLGNGQARSCKELKPQQCNPFSIVRTAFSSLARNMWLQCDSMLQESNSDGTAYTMERTKRVKGTSIRMYRRYGVRREMAFFLP